MTTNPKGLDAFQRYDAVIEAHERCLQDLEEALQQERRERKRDDAELWDATWRGVRLHALWLVLLVALVILPFLSA